MSDNQRHGAHTIRASKGGGGKWLLGAAAAIVVIGGGYFAWRTYGQPDNTQAAYNNGYGAYDDPLRAGPLESGFADDVAESEVAEPAATSAPPPARRAQARTTPVPEATIGVTPASVSEEEAAADDGEIVITAPPRPIWVRTPSERRLTSLYPTRALERGREGEARLSCIVQDGGALDCEKTAETPGGGFGNAALRVARTLRHAPRRADGSDAAGSPVNLRVVFRIDDETRRG